MKNPQSYLVAALLCATPAFASDPVSTTNDDVLDILVVTGTRFADRYDDKPLNVSVITREDIDKSSARTVPELLSAQVGMSVRDFFGNNAASTTVDLRGFGAGAGQNTLILVDGRRVTDADLAGVQWSAIPLASVERIEVLRGGGSVLYGAGATGGVINIITKSPVQGAKSLEVNALAGGYGLSEIQANGNYLSGTSALSVAASRLNSEGYRGNNHNAQTNARAQGNWMLGAGELKLKLDADHQYLRLPGARQVQASTGVNLVATNPRGAATPLDYSSRDGNQVAVEWEQSIADTEVNIGVGHRNKNQKSYFDFSGFPSYRDSDLSVTSLTPRMKVPHTLGGESALVLGLDMYRWNYALRTSNAEANIGRPINRVSMSQENDAWYAQNTTRISDVTSILAGVRGEKISMRGLDVFDAAAPGGAGGSGAPAASFTSSNSAYELGLRRQLGDGMALTAKAGHGFRFANVDEIYESTPTFTKQFQFLRPQLSDTMEFGLERHSDRTDWRAALFNTKVSDEIHLDAFSSGIGNTNLPPSRRRGLELEGKWKVTATFRMNAGYTYTDARFLSGVLPGSAGTQLNVNIAGKHVPLVPGHRLNLDASWAMDANTSLNAALSYAGSQFMDNDEANDLGIKIPAYALADLKLLHRAGAWQWTAAVNNLFNRSYFTYAVKSTSTAGRYNAYPLPGRTFFIGASYQQ